MGRGVRGVTGCLLVLLALLVGRPPSRYPDDYSWAQFKSDLRGGPLHDKLVSDPALRYKVSQLEKIASQPEPQRFSSYSQGGTPAGVYSQAQKIFCHNLTADPGSIPIINTYFLHPDAKGGNCSRQAVNSISGRFKSQIDAVASATGNRP